MKKMKTKTEALVAMIICIFVGFSSPFLTFYIENEASVNGVKISFPDLIPWQFMMIFCMLGALVFFIIYINPSIVDGKNPGELV